ncbi:chemotaxis protein CheW [Vibrio olivae]|uniref:Chemotaxis protein CheW n=1 Tax=Vibrio olivae TaxID=1243002 RepID=A0ABV5HKS7_9VIBR
MSRSLLSSEQALDDYFSALLDDEFELAEEATEPQLQPKPLLQPIDNKSYYSVAEPEIDLPNLNDVERLLKQLETVNPVEELQLEEVLESNTDQIAAEQATVENLDTHEVIDEIQDWDISDLEPESIQTDIEPAVAIETTTELEIESVEEDIPAIEVEEEPLAQPEYTVPDIDFETQRFVEPEPSIEPEVAVEVELETQVDGPLQAWNSTERVNDFQVLYFEVNAVTFAVPLDELGGIHQMAELSHLIGRPKWYLGLQSSRESQIDVVDTARWVMAEKLTDEEYKENYQYIVMLGDSSWGLASSQLMGTETLDPDKVRWRKTAGKRPWLAGMVKEKMCALIHVEALVAMLKAGLDVKALDK